MDTQKTYITQSKTVLASASQALFYSLILSHTIFIPYAYAGPTGERVVGGQGNINRSGSNTTITQHTQSMAINWDSYNVNANERVQYIQPNASAISLNRILDTNGSQIHGQINANGQVILVNPNGVFFGASSRVNAGNIIASGLDISPSDFMNGRYLFNALPNASGQVVNQGLLEAANGGSVTLLGKTVRNEGMISAKLGRVNLAVGEKASLLFNREGTIGVKITQEVLQNDLGIDPALINSGEINAEGGQVLLTASVSRDVFSQAVNSGNLSATTSVVTNPDGSISLKKGADVLNSGVINVSSNDQSAGDVVILGENITHSGTIEANTQTGNTGHIELHANNTVELTGNSQTAARAETSGNGGDIKILGNKVGVLDNSTVDASGANGGGTALIGGDKLGENKRIRNADFLYVGEQTTVSADALDSGDGGKVITYADNTARVYGRLFARGGINGGNGGFIETSGKQGFEILQAPDTSSTLGQNGLWLIDPYNITIHNADDSDYSTNSGNPIRYTANGNDARISVGTLVGALGSNNVLVYTNDNVNGNQAGNITFDATLDYNGIGTGNTLTLRAFNDIIFADNASIFDSNLSIVDSLDNLNVTLEANNGAGLNSGNGNISFGVNTSIDTRGGNFIASGNDFDSGTATINVGSGSIDLDGMVGDVTVGNLIASNAGSSDLSIQNAANITQQAGTIITIGRDAFLGNSSTNTINLNQSNSNFFGRNINLQANIANVTATGRIRLNSGSTINSSLSLSSDNLIESNGFITVSNGSNNATATFNTTDDVRFTNSNNNFDQVTVINADDVVLVDSNSIALGNITTGSGGTLDVTSGNQNNAAITQVTGTALNIGNDASFTTADTNLNNSGNTVTLQNTGNVFNGTVSATADRVELTDSSALVLGQITINDTDNQVSRFTSTGGNITQQTGTAIDNDNTGAVTIFDAGSNDVILNAFVAGNNALTNDFTEVRITNANNVSLTEQDTIALGTSNIANDLTLHAGANGLSGDTATTYIVNAASNSAVTVGGNTTLTSRNNSGTNYSINLDSTANNFNDVTLANATNVTLVDNTDAINLQTSNTINTLTVTANGTATGSTINNVSSGTLNVSGAANFTVANNQSIDLSENNHFGTNPNFTASSGQINNLTVTDTGLSTLTLQDNLNTNGNLNVTAQNITLQNTTVGNNLTLTATEMNSAPALIGDITQSIDNSDSLVVTGTSTLNAETITLDHSGNDFQSGVVINNTLSNVTLVDGNGGIQLGDGSAFTSNTLNITSTGGNITQASDITTGVSTFDAGSNNILLDTNTGNNFTGAITISDAANVQLDNSTATTLQAANISNDLTVNSGSSLTLGGASETISVGRDLVANAAGNISQTGSASILTVGRDTQLTARTALNVDQDITLNNASNDFNNVNIINARNVSLRDSTDAIAVQGNISGFLNVRADGSIPAGFVITNPGELNVTSSATFTVSDGESINVGNAANTFTVDPVFNTVSGFINNLVVNDDSNLALQNNLNLSGDLTVSATDITFRNTNLTAGNLTATSDTGQIQQAAGTSLTIGGTSTLDGGSGGITLAEANDFQNTVAITTNSLDTLNQPSDVVINDSNTLDIGASSIAGDLTISASNVTQTNDGTQGTNDGISVANAATFIVDDNSSVTLDNIDNQFNAVTFSASTSGAFLNNVTISNTGALDLQGLRLNGNLTATSLSNITQTNLTSTGALDVNGTTQLTGNNITLNNSANDFTDLTIVSGATVAMTDSNTLNFADTSAISDSLTINVLNGNLTDSATAVLQVANNTALTTQNGNIVLDNGNHDFNSVQLSSSGDTTMSDINSIDLRDSIIGGNLSVTADTSNSGTDNTIQNSTGDIVVSGSSTFMSSAGADIQLARVGSSHALSGGISATGTGNTTLDNVQINNGVDTQLQTISANNLQVNSAGNITDGGAINVTDLSSLSATGDIDLTASPSDNSLNRLAVSSANNVHVSNANALALEAINTTGELQVSAEGITTSNDLSANSGMNLNAGNGVLAINNNLTSNSGALTLTGQTINQSSGTNINAASVTLTSTGDVNQNGDINTTAGDLILNVAQSLNMGAGASSNSADAINITAVNANVQSLTANNAINVTSTAGNITQNQTIASTTSTVDLNSAQAIVMTATSNTQAADNITYTSVSDQSLASLSTSTGTVSVTASNGAINDANGDSTNLSASTVTLRANNGIGAGDAIETTTAELDVINNGAGASTVEINNTGDVRVTNLVNTGDINFDNSSNVTLNNIDAGFTAGTLRMNIAEGSVFGVDRGNGNDFFNIPDITADTAIITVNGEFGTFERPIVLRLNSEFFLASSISSTFFLGGPPPINNDTSDLQFSVFDSINSVSGQQLIEVESLADIDPAIFTDLRNFSIEETPIRLPRDQVFEDELEEYDQQ